MNNDQLNPNSEGAPLAPPPFQGANAPVPPTPPPFGTPATPPTPPPPPAVTPEPAPVAPPSEPEPTPVVEPQEEISYADAYEQEVARLERECAEEQERLKREWEEDAKRRKIEEAEQAYQKRKKAQAMAAAAEAERQARAAETRAQAAAARAARGETEPPVEPPKKQKSIYRERWEGCLLFLGIMAVCVVVGLYAEGFFDDDTDSAKPRTEQVVSQNATSEQPTPTATADEVKAAESAADASVAFARKPYTGSVMSLPRPKRLVNDYACIFPESTIAQLEDSLRAFADHTSNQITIVTVTDLEGYTPNQFATEIGNRWGAGKKGRDNGIVILIKPKTAEEKGKVYIATGRGLEGALPDVLCKRIVENQMMPHLKAGNDYVSATWAALEVVMPVCRGEYDIDKYDDDNPEPFDIWLWIGLIMIFGFLGICLFGFIDAMFLKDYFAKKWGWDTYTGGGSWIFSSHSSRSSSSSDDWDDWGGGSFGGGGAGGEW
ncbi:MAG: TPM domain-containing protein [Bacteroidales bacterium]|nr:TPM domain-containing protein [Bacteroidales bacterium]